MFKQRNFAIMAILVLSMSVFSMTQANSQIGNELSFSNETNDLQYITLYSTQRYDSLEISDNVSLVKNNVEIQATIFDKDTQKDSIAISDSVILAKHVVVTHDSNWDTVAILERITERTKSEELSNISTNQLSNEIIFDELTLTNQNGIIQSYINFELFETSTLLTNQLSLFENDLTVNMSTQNIVGNSFATEIFDPNNSESFLVLLLAPFAGFVLLLRNNF